MAKGKAAKKKKAKKKPARKKAARKKMGKKRPYLVPPSFSAGSYLEKEAYKYHIYLVINNYYENYQPMENLKVIINNFGNNLRNVKVLLPQKSAYSVTRSQVLRRRWKMQDWEILDQKINPYLLIITGPLSRFSPNRNQFIIIDFPKNPGNVSKYVSILQELEREIRTGQSLFVLNKAKKKQQVRSKFLKKLYDATDIRFGAGGISIDIKKLIERG